MILNPLFEDSLMASQTLWLASPSDKPGITGVPLIILWAHKFWILKTGAILPSVHVFSKLKLEVYGNATRLTLICSSKIGFHLYFNTSNKCCFSWKAKSESFFWRPVGLPRSGVSWWNCGGSQGWQKQYEELPGY